MADNSRPSRQIASTTSLQELLEQLRVGNDKARVLLIERLQGRLRQRIHRMLTGSFKRKPALAETGEVLQDVRICLYRALAEVKPEDVDGLIGLAVVQARRVLLDLCRKVDRDPLLPVSQLANSSGSSPLEQVAAQTPGVSTREVYKILLEELVPRLNDIQTPVFERRLYFGLSFPEIGELLGIGEEVAKKRWQSAKLQLRRWLRERGVESTDFM